jgi:hypothetical protein
MDAETTGARKGLTVALPNRSSLQHVTKQITHSMTVGEMRGSHGGEDVNADLVCDAVWTHR